jgi:hypothetical protein
MVRRNRAWRLIFAPTTKQEPCDCLMPSKATRQADMRQAQCKMCAEHKCVHMKETEPRRRFETLNTKIQYNTAECSWFIGLRRGSSDGLYQNGSTGGVRFVVVCTERHIPTTLPHVALWETSGPLQRTECISRQ